MATGVTPGAVTGATSSPATGVTPGTASFTPGRGRGPVAPAGSAAGWSWPCKSWHSKYVTRSGGAAQQRTQRTPEGRGRGRDGKGHPVMGPTLYVEAERHGPRHRNSPRPGRGRSRTAAPTRPHAVASHHGEACRPKIKLLFRIVLLNSCRFGGRCDDGPTALLLCQAGCLKNLPHFFAYFFSS